LAVARLTKTKLMIMAAAFSCLAVLVLAFFPGQALLADNSCIRFVAVPFSSVRVTVPFFVVPLFAGVALLSIISAVVSFLISLRIARCVLF
jgi:hypothetical protein